MAKAKKAKKSTTSRFRVSFTVKAPAEFGLTAREVRSQYKQGYGAVDLPSGEDSKVTGITVTRG